MTGPERPERLVQVRAMILRFITGFNYNDSMAFSMDDKVEVVKQSMELMNVPWDPAEGPLWAEVIEYVEDGGQLSDSYLIAWRRRYRSVLGIG